MTSRWNAAQCGQVMEAYSTIVTGAFGEPWTISVDLISMFCPVLAELEIGFEFWPHAVKARTANTDITAALRWVFVMTRFLVFSGPFVTEPWSSFNEGS